MVGSASGGTVTRKLCVALRLGEPLSATFRRTRLVLFACATAGLHVNRPVFVPMAEPLGEANKLNANVCQGRSASLARFVTTSVTPAATARLEMAASDGAALAGPSAAISELLNARV